MKRKFTIEIEGDFNKGKDDLDCQVTVTPDLSTNPLTREEFWILSGATYIILKEKIREFVES